MVLLSAKAFMPALPTFYEVVARHRAKLAGKLGGASAFQFVGMQLKTEPKVARGF